MGGTPQGARPGDNFTLPLSARVADAYGNAIASKTVKFQAPTSGALATFPVTDSVTTDAQGVAKVSVKANNVSGVYTVTAAPTGITLSDLANFQLTNFTSLESWRATNFKGEWQSTGAAADNAMPFRDDVPNLLNYAFNLNAQGPDHTMMTATGTTGLPLVTNSQGRWTVTFVRRRAATLPGISYGVQFAQGLTNASFAENSFAITSTPVAIDATWERVTVTDSVPTNSTSARFARVQITAP